MLEDIKGIGDKIIKILNKLNIKTKEDLIKYYPFRYNILKKTELNGDIDKAVVEGVVLNSPYVIYIKKKLDKMNFKVQIDNKIVNVTIFNRAFYKNRLIPGGIITILGKYDYKHNLLTASDIRFQRLPNIPVIEPIYHVSNGISCKQLNNLINEVHDVDIIDYIPSYLSLKYQFMDKLECIHILHNPYDIDKLKQARLRLKYEELFMFMLKINYLKNNKSIKIGLKRNVDYNVILDFISNLPFKLTVDQENAIKDIYNDLTSDKRMNRLLQGDVGSGKTIVSFIALYINYLSGYQGVLMAPTEILAIQHYNNLKKQFPNINIGLLTGKLKVREKKKIYEDLKSGECSIIIGTHALFSDDVIYKNLGLVITDEQHRFGVNQRSSLKNKGITPDILYMSATPIPRTYALTLYGDMDISSIKTMPSGRLSIKTFLKTNKEIKDVLDIMYNEIKLNHQIYVIAPLIEESDKIDLENVYELEKNLNKALGSVANIEVLHGKMHNEEKDIIMERFKNNETQILISTTVIEVGVDVSNATLIVIYDAFRFGLSQLHQLRGRVGRNNLQSYCVLISDMEKDRLKVLCETNDGFKVSEEDFKLRGSGDLFGTRQSGDMIFELSDIKRDFNLLIKAKDDSYEFLEKYMDDYPFIKNVIYDSNNLD